jgi:putative flippase GtrA
VTSLIARFYAERTWPFQLARYLTIGGFVFVIDIGSFAGFLRLGWPLMLVATVAYGLGICTHFTLNKYVNFRAHDRPLQHQAATYGMVAFLCWLTTLGIIKLAVGFGVPPLAGKLIAVGANLPLGFLGHRYLTFGRGISATVRHFFARPPSP